MKFYPRDWRGDQSLRAVSVAARGLWMECLCIMHEARPYGHLVLNGVPVEGDTLARMTGVPVDEVSALMAELRQAGVLSVTGKGVVFSRRMTKDHARAQKGRKAANRRWAQVSGDVEQSEAPNRSPSGSPTTQKPEARQQNSSSLRSERAPPGFDAFWSAYPHKVGKADAAKAFAKAVKRTDLDTLMAGLKRYAAKTDDRPWCNPSTWLNQDRWTDQPAAPVARAGPAPQQGRPPQMADIFKLVKDGNNGRQEREDRNGTGSGIPYLPAAGSR
jgi:hypothetical protein